MDANGKHILPSYQEAMEVKQKASETAMSQIWGEALFVWEKALLRDA